MVEVDAARDGVVVYRYVSYMLRPIRGRKSMTTVGKPDGHHWRSRANFRKEFYILSY